jgi:hypothetical protein
MLEKIKQYGLEKFAGNEELANEFVKGFVTQVAMEKAASDGRGRGREDEGYGKQLMRSVVDNFGRNVGSLGVNMLTGTAMGIGRFVADGSRHTRFLEALRQALASSEFLQKQPRAKVENYANTIYKFAPMVSTDPNLLQSVLTNAVHGDGVDITIIKTLTDLESRWRESGSIQPKTFV